MSAEFGLTEQEFQEAMIEMQEEEMYMPTEEEMDEMYRMHCEEDAKDIELELKKGQREYDDSDTPGIKRYL